MTQQELELESHSAGRAKAVRMMQNNEEKGQAHNNPYASAIYRRFLLPLRDVITAATASTGPGSRAAHVALLRGLDAASVAYIAVRSTLVGVIADAAADARKIARTIGGGVYSELVLATFEELDPELYYKIVHDLDRRHSHSATHRFVTLKMSGQRAGIEVPMWSKGAREQVGLWLLEQLRLLSMVEIERVNGRNVRHFVTRFTEETQQTISEIKGIVEITMPYHLPFVEQPKDWTSLADGGYHTIQMRRLLPYCVNVMRYGKSRRIEELRKADLSAELEALNRLQAVRWQINGQMLDTMTALARHMDLGEVVSQSGIPKPERPAHIPEKGAELNDEQKRDLMAWRRDMAEWHTQMKLRGTRWGRFKQAREVAEKFRDRGAIYFLYQCDFRGRKYAITTGVSPQGSDMQKALLRFADGLPLIDGDAVRWFKMLGANKFGVDKVPFAERIQWVDDNAALIVACADDPLGNKDWTEADCPLQFLAWAQEFAEWRRSPTTFVSHLPVGFDGSCNGIQHFSAMLRDARGGAAVNLLPSDRPNDIYQQVADDCTVRLERLRPEDERREELRQTWLRHGINRKLVKRSVMTLPYGSTRFSASQFIKQDYLHHGLAPEFEKHVFAAAAEFLSRPVWESIEAVVVAAPQAMGWLQRAAREIVKTGEQEIGWVSPSGFPVTQVYSETVRVDVRSRFLGGVRIRMDTESDDADSNRHKNAVAPNFVHSMDAAHLTLTINAAGRQGIAALAMIHDDYGCHAAHAQKLFHTIRQTFVEMYEAHDPLAAFQARYPFLPDPPARGDLDIRLVLGSPYFFA